MQDSATTIDTDQTRGQFSLSALMWVLTGSCVLLALLVMPMLLTIVCCVGSVTVTGALLITIWKGRGWVQPFALGALVPHLLGVVAILNAQGSLQIILFLGLAEALACTAGLGSAAFASFLSRRGGHLPIPSLPLVRDWLSNDEAVASNE